MEYACPVFYDSLPIDLSEELQKLQRRAFRIIFPTLSYAEALVLANVVSLFDRRQDLTSKFLNDIVNDESHKLTYYRTRTFQSITCGKREFLKVLIVGQIGLETVLFRTILRCVIDKLYNFV